MVKLIKSNEEAALEQNIISDTPTITPKGDDGEGGIKLIKDDNDPFQSRETGNKPDADFTQESNEDDELIREKERKKEARKRRQENMRNKLNNADMIIEENTRMSQKMQKLESELENLKKLASQYQTGTLDKEIHDTELKIQYYETQLEDAISNADGKQARIINSLIREESDKRAQLRMQKEQQARQFNTQPQPQSNQYDPFSAPETQYYKSEFIKEHDWFNSNDPDDEFDKKVAYQIDAQVYREGYNPASPAYWNELKRRLKEVLPDRYDNYEPAKTAPVQASTTAANQKTPAAGKNTIRLKDLNPMQRDILVRQGHISTDGVIKNKAKVEYYVSQWFKNK